MSTFQKVIKYLALAFALFLVVSIFTGIFSAVYSMGNIFDGNKDTSITEMSGKEMDAKDTKALMIDLGAAELEIKTGERLLAETNNSDINVKQNGDVLQIKEKSHNWFRTSNHSKVVVYVPEDMEFDKVGIDSGAGEITIESLTTDVLDLDLGAGEVNIDYLEVKKAVDIDGGTGETTIRSGSLCNLELDMGIGAADVSTKLSGDCDLDMGIGELALTVLGDKADYTIEVNKGVGEYTIDGEKIGDNEKIGNGTNYLQLDGGIGAVKVEFQKTK